MIPVGKRKEEITPVGSLGLALRQDLCEAQKRTSLYLLRASQKSPAPERWDAVKTGLSPQ